MESDLITQSNLITTIILGVISPTATLTIGFITYNLVKKQFRQQFEFNRDQHQVQGLLEAFRVLDSREHRDSRRKVYDLYHDYLGNKIVEIFKNVAQVEDVRADFDVMGTLVNSNNIHKPEFLEEYGPLAYICCCVYCLVGTTYQIISDRVISKLSSANLNKPRTAGEKHFE